MGDALGSSFADKKDQKRKQELPQLHRLLLAGLDRNMSLFWLLMMKKMKKKEEKGRSCAYRKDQNEVLG